MVHEQYIRSVDDLISDERTQTQHVHAAPRTEAASYCNDH